MECRLFESLLYAQRLITLAFSHFAPALSYVKVRFPVSPPNISSTVTKNQLFLSAAIKKNVTDKNGP